MCSHGQRRPKCTQEQAWGLWASGTTHAEPNQVKNSDPVKRQPAQATQVAREAPSIRARGMSHVNHDLVVGLLITTFALVISLFGSGTMVEVVQSINTVSLR